CGLRSTLRNRDLRGFSVLQHLHDPPHTPCGGEMLQGVSADDVQGEIVNRLVCEFEDLGGDVSESGESEFARSGVLRRIQPDDERNDERGQELDEEIEAQVVCPLPVDDAEDADAEQKRKQ